MSKRKDITTPTDLEELKKSYQFILESANGHSNDTPDTETTSWQDRMVIKYHKHLYKTYVIADLSRYEYSEIGLRWRTKSEVDEEKGVETCGNKHCPCYFEKGRKKSVREIREWRTNINENYLVEKYIQKIPTKQDGDTEYAEDGRLQCLPYGIGLCDYEVHFAYVEKGEEKEELVKLKLCLRCAPKLFFAKGGSLEARKARCEINWCLSNINEERSDAMAGETFVKQAQHKKRYKNPGATCNDPLLCQKRRREEGT